MLIIAIIRNNLFPFIPFGVQSAHFDSTNRFRYYSNQTHNRLFFSSSNHNLIKFFCIFRFSLLFKLTSTGITTYYLMLNDCENYFIIDIYV